MQKNYQILGNVSNDGKPHQSGYVVDRGGTTNRGRKTVQGSN